LLVIKLNHFWHLDILTAKSHLFHSADRFAIMVPIEKRLNMLYQTESMKQDDFKPARFTSEGSITLNGKTIPYKTVSEDNVFYDSVM
jgi:hypothetical protein